MMYSNNGFEFQIIWEGNNKPWELEVRESQSKLW